MAARAANFRSGLTWRLIPLLNLLFALVIAGLVVLIIGENPLEAMWIMLKGAVGSLKGWGYLLYYATNFVFTGLAVAVAFHAGPLQHRRRGPGLYGRRWRRDRGSEP